MAEDLFRQRFAQCHQDDGPIDGVEAKDILADDVDVCRPVFFIKVAGIAVGIVAQSGDVIRKCVDPDVDDVLVVKGDGDAPFKGGSGDAEILKSGF